MSIFSKKKELKTTPFSDFIRNASSAEKKRVYKKVLEKATERQLQTMKEADALK